MEDDLYDVLGLGHGGEEAVGIADHDESFLVIERILSFNLFLMEPLKGDFTSMIKDERSEFFEVDFLVKVLVHSEKVPKDVIKFFLGALFQDFNGKGLKLFVIEITIAFLVVLVEIHL